MQIQQRHGGHGAQMGAFFLEGFVPSLVGRQPGGAAMGVLVVPVELGLQEGIGGAVVRDVLVGQEGDEAFLEEAETALDLALGRGVGGHAVGHAQGGESALELGMSVEAVGGGAMAKEGQAVGVEAGGSAVGFEGRTQVHEVIPGGVAADEGAGDDFAGVIIEGEQEHGVMVGGPPGVGRAVVLPEFADGAGLPTAAGFGTAFGGGDLLGKMLADVGGHRGAGTVEVMTAGQFVGQQGEVERLAMGQKLDQEIVRRLGPGFFVVAAGGTELKARAVLKPLMAELVETGGTDHEPLGGGEGVERAVVEGAEDFPEVERGNAVSQLLFFIPARVTEWGRCPQAPEVYRFAALVEKGPAGKRKRLQSGLKPLAEPLNRGALDAAQVALPQSPILRRSEATLPRDPALEASPNPPSRAKPNFDPTTFLVLI